MVDQPVGRQHHARGLEGEVCGWAWSPPLILVYGGDSCRNAAAIKRTSACGARRWADLVVGNEAGIAFTQEHRHQRLRGHKDMVWNGKGQDAFGQGGIVGAGSFGFFAMARCWDTEFSFTKEGTKQHADACPTGGFMDRTLTSASSSRCFGSLYWSPLLPMCSNSSR